MKWLLEEGCEFMLSPRNRSASQGLTLIEVLITIMVIGVAFSAIATTMLSYSRGNQQVILKNEVARLTEQYMEKYRQAGSYGTMRTDTVENVTVAGRSITFQTDFCPTDGPTTMACDSASVYIRVTALNGTTVIQKTETFFTAL